MYYLSERDRQIQKSINAKVRALPPIDTWRTNRRTFSTGQATVTTAGEAAEDIPTGAVGTINLYKGPLSAPTLLVDGTGGAGGGFSTGFSSGFSISGSAYITIEAYNLTETPIWTGARVIVAKIVLRGGEPDSSGYVVVEHNSAGVIRATAPGGGVSAGATVNFSNVIPIDGIYVPTTADIYCPVDVTNSQVVVAERNYNANRWEADPAAGNPAPSGDTVRVVRVHQAGAVAGQQIAPVLLSEQVWDARMMTHSGTQWLDATPDAPVWLVGTNSEERWLSLNFNERLVGWFIGERTYNSQTRPAYAAYLCTTAYDQYFGTKISSPAVPPSFGIPNNTITYLQLADVGGNAKPGFGGMRSADDAGDARNAPNACIQGISQTTLRITKTDNYLIQLTFPLSMTNFNQNALAVVEVAVPFSADNVTYGGSVINAATLTFATSGSSYDPVYGDIRTVAMHGIQFLEAGTYLRLSVYPLYLVGTPGIDPFVPLDGEMTITRIQHTTDLN